MCVVAAGCFASTLHAAPQDQAAASDTPIIGADGSAIVAPVKRTKPQPFSVPVATQLPAEKSAVVNTDKPKLKAAKVKAAAAKKPKRFLKASASR